MQNCIIFFQTLVSNIMRYARFIAILAHCIHKVSITPKFSTPKLLFHFWMLLEYFPSSKIFYCRNDLRGTLCWHTLYQEMNMIFVNTYFQKMNFIALPYFNTDILQGFINFFTEYYTLIFCRASKCYNKIDTLYDL